MNKFKPYLIIAAIVVAVIVVIGIVKPMLPASISQYL